MKKLYAERDTETGSIADLYMEHLGAMTTESLRSKSAIAAELAWRDETIIRLEAELRWIKGEEL